jgi:hypothetical protein
MAEAERRIEGQLRQPSLDPSALTSAWPFARSNLRLLDAVLDYSLPAHKEIIRSLNDHGVAYGRVGPFTKPQLEALAGNLARDKKHPPFRLSLPSHVFPVVLRQNTLTRHEKIGAVVPLLCRQSTDWHLSPFGPFQGNNPQQRLVRLVDLLEQQWRQGPLPLLGRRRLSIELGLDIAPASIQGHSEELPLAVLILRECCAQKSGTLPLGAGPVFSTGAIDFEGRLKSADGLDAKLDAFVRECGEGHTAILLRDQRRQLSATMESAFGEILEVESLFELVNLDAFLDGLKAISGPPGDDELPRLQDMANRRESSPGADRVSRYLHHYDLLASRTSISATRTESARLRGLTANNMPGWKGETNQALIGRELELDELDMAFDDPRCSMVCIIAEGGYGKSSLVTRWLERIRDKPASGQYMNVQAGFAYSFYKQGWERQGALSSVPFFEECLLSLSLNDPPHLPKAGMEGWVSELLGLLSRQRSLLVLDGLEPHQAPVSSGSAGEIQDTYLKTFLKGLAFPAGGLCIITSRVMPPELKGPFVESGRVRCIFLGPLSLDASQRLLESSGLLTEIPYWARESRGHPLLLALLAPAISRHGYNAETFESHRVLLDNVLDNKETIQRFVASHLNSLGPYARDVLFSACLFDKPVEYINLRNLLLRQANISGVTTSLYRASGFLRRSSFSEKRFREGVDALRKAAMLTLSGSPHRLDEWKLEVHPIIQAGVRADLKGTQASAWRRANWIIYRSMVRSVKAHMPSTKGELTILYDAVPHGVNAGRGLKAGWMYGIRCLRGFRAYSTNNHGMIGFDVALMSHYFEDNWKGVKENIGVSEDKYANVQSYVWAGTLLTAVNRWDEGWPLMERGLGLAIENRDFITAARTARHLATGHAIAGHLTRGESYARQSTELLENKTPLHVRIVEYVRAPRFSLVSLDHERTESKATLGSLLHYQGSFQQAGEAFREAEEYQRRATGFAGLRGLACFHHVQMLLDLGQCDEADRLVELGLSTAGAASWLGELISALLDLAFVQSKIRRADILGDLRDWPLVRLRAERFVNAWHGQELRLDWAVPLFLIAQSGVARLSGDLMAAISMIDGAKDRVRHVSNRLLETDVCIEEARSYLALGNGERARNSVTRADILSKSLGYGCKYSEITTLKGQIEQPKPHESPLSSKQCPP